MQTRNRRPLPDTRARRRWRNGHATPRAGKGRALRLDCQVCGLLDVGGDFGGVDRHLQVAATAPRQSTTHRAPHAVSNSTGCTANRQSAIAPNVAVVWLLSAVGAAVARPTAAAAGPPPQALTAPIAIAPSV